MHNPIDLVALAATNGYRVDLGQFSKAERAAMDRAAKRGELIKARLCWPWLSHGTCMKTFFINATPKQEAA